MSNITGDGGSFSSENNIGGDQEIQQQQEQYPVNGPSATSLPPVKKKSNLPGTPDPTAEVIALSPATLMATNRFVCEICNKGFKRDQNLQLHRRGHNLPWKLKQRPPGAEVRKRVYVCPEASCVHHSPLRALGDLTGIKKHFRRKHGEKKWKCDKCSKKYAVQSDWKAHSKTCGTREYKCDCGTIFSRRESFITHRAFCDALAEENSKAMVSPITPSIPGSLGIADSSSLDVKHSLRSLAMAGPVLSTTSPPLFSPRSLSTATFDGLTHMAGSAHMSATALLQKAAQIGATASGGGGGGGGGSCSPTMQRGLVAGMAGHDMKPYGLYGLMGIDGRGFSDHLFDGLAGGSEGLTMNDGGVFPLPAPAAAGGGDEGFLKGLERQESSSGSNGILMRQRSGGLGVGSFGSGDVTTLDFLGLGGARSAASFNRRRLEFEGAVGQTGMQGFNQFQEQISRDQPGIEKPMWDV